MASTGFSSDLPMTNTDDIAASYSGPTMSHPWPNRLSVYYHTHWDREWYLPFRQYQLRLARVLDRLLSVLLHRQLPCFALDGQTILLEDVLELRPQYESALQMLVCNEQLSVGPWYVMPDEFLVSGESLVRNLVRGIYQARAFGQNTFTGYIPDTFGHGADMPMILNHCGLSTAMLWRGVNPDTPWFWWESLSGDKVLTYHLTEGYFQNVFHMGEDLAEKQQWTQQWQQKVGALTPAPLPMLFPVGADHLGFDPITVDDTRHCLGNVDTVTPDRWMIQTLEAVKETETQLPTIHGELIDCSAQYLLKGTFSSRMYLKQANRRLEWTLTQQVEPLLTWLTMVGLPLQESATLDLCWKLLLQNHPHDSICGCSIDEVHRENETRFAQLDQLTAGLTQRAQSQLFKTLGIDHGLVVINTSHVPFRGVIEVQGHYSTAQPLPDLPEAIQPLESHTALDQTFMTNTSVLPLSEHQATLRRSLAYVDQALPHSISVFQQCSTPSDVVMVEPDSLENQFLKVTVGCDGTLTFHDKLTDTPYPNQAWIRRVAEQGDSYNSAPNREIPAERGRLLEVTVLEPGPLRGALRCRYEFSSIGLILETDLRLAVGSTRIDFQTRFLNQTPDHKIQVGFTAATPIDQVEVQGHFNPVQRTIDPHYRLEDHMPAAKLKELPTNTGAIQQFIRVGRQTWITQGLTEYETYQESLFITLHRGFGWLSSNETEVRGSHAGPPLPTPEGQCLNRPFVCNYSWALTDHYTEAYIEAQRVYGACYGFEQWSVDMSALFQSPSVVTSPTTTQFLTWDNPHVMASAMIPTLTGWTLRLFNPTATAQSARIKWPVCQNRPLRVSLCDALENVETPLEPTSPSRSSSSSDEEVSLTLSPYSLQTILFNWV